MEHIMKLFESDFDNLKSGKKKREYRLNDDKRKQVRIGDTIRFLKLPNLDEEFVVDVKNIEVFSNWYDCYSKYYDEDFKNRYSSVEAVVQDTYDGGYYTKEESTRLVNENKENELIDFSVMANGKIAAGTYYNDFLPGGENDFIRYIDGTDGKSEILNSIDIPILVVFGNVDECVLTQPIDIVKDYLNNNIRNCNIQIIDGADHSYTNKYEELGKVISNNF